MNLIVNHSELSKIATSILEDNDNLYKLLEQIGTTIEKVGNYWYEDENSDNFIEEGLLYIEEQQEERKVVEILGLVLGIVSGIYKESEINWANHVKKIGELNNDSN